MANIFAFENQKRLGDVRAMQLEIDARKRQDLERTESEARQQRLLADMQQASDVVSITSSVVRIDTAIAGHGHVRVFIPDAAV